LKLNNKLNGKKNKISTQNVKRRGGKVGKVLDNRLHAQNFKSLQVVQRAALFSLGEQLQVLGSNTGIN